MAKEAPFDVWDGSELGLTDEVDVEDGPAEEVAMHVDPEWEPETEAGPHWSDLTEEDEDEVDTAAPVRYFSDEQPEIAARRQDTDEVPEPALDELLERQHYAFRPGR